MRPGQNRRKRGRNRNKGPNPLTRTYESNGPDVKIRGTAQHIADKYAQLARDAQASGDPVAGLGPLGLRLRPRMRLFCCGLIESTFDPRWLSTSRETRPAARNGLGPPFASIPWCCRSTAGDPGRPSGFRVHGPRRSAAKPPDARLISFRPAAGCRFALSLRRIHRTVHDLRWAN